MANGVVKVGRHSYAVGLFWQPSPSGRVAQAAREAAQQQGQKADFFCVRQASKTVAVPQYGLGQSSMGHRAGQPTLAASLANAQPGSWAGAFRLREGTWVAVVRDDLVAPDGDFLFDNDEQARERLLQEVSLGGMQRIYAPDGWAIPGSDPTPLPLLVQDRAESKLQPVTLPVQLIMFGVAALVVVGAIIFFALQWQDEQRQQEEAAAQQASGVIGNMVGEWKWPPADQVYPHTWEISPRAAEVVAQCHELLGQVQASQLGWKMAGLICENSAISMDYQRNGKMAAISMPDAMVAETLKSSGRSVKGTELSLRGTEETLTNILEINRIGLNRNWPFEVTRLPDDPPKVAPPQHVKDPPPPPPPPWSKRGIKYTGKSPPWNMMRFLEGIPGLIINRIIRNADDSWTLEATIYEMKGGV